jgi:hypothetical protein
VAKPGPENKRKAKPAQPPLPGMPPPEPPGTVRILPMQLEVGDRFSDESGEWEIVGRPYSTVGGKKTEVRVRRSDKPGVTETRTWGSYEKITVIRRASTEEGKR